MEYVVTIQLIQNRQHRPREMGSQKRKRMDTKEQAIETFEAYNSELAKNYKEIKRDEITPAHRNYIRLSVIENGYPIKEAFYVDR